MTFKHMKQVKGIANLDREAVRVEERAADPPIEKKIKKLYWLLLIYHIP